VVSVGVELPNEVYALLSQLVVGQVLIEHALSVDAGDLVAAELVEVHEAVLNVFNASLRADELEFIRQRFCLVALGVEGLLGRQEPALVEALVFVHELGEYQFELVRTDVVALQHV